MLSSGGCLADPGSRLVASDLVEQSEEAADAPGRPPQFESSVIVGQSIAEFFEEMDARQVHELEAAEIDDHVPFSVDEQTVESFLDGRGGGEVYLAGDLDHARGDVAPYLDAQCGPSALAGAVRLTALLCRASGGRRLEPEQRLRWRFVSAEMALHPVPKGPVSEWFNVEEL